ncbi:ras GTPase-activating protein-binding protein 1-like [Chenopodium quinoa]|uniref:ras GTPase-activating protein-binding protein 1-like n=1 Tax=Chenopodium quinoa TaxID=63459 RepID=UPI000B79380D|nr:ras GTPase-activating protein-binding protein 1-like [Chenopodium quinoa]
MAAPTVQSQPQAPCSYIPPDEVGNAFARQYYTILQQSPALVYRFYQDISKLGRPGDDGVMGFTSTMDAINAKILSYGSLKADIKFVDAQESYNGGVIVLVTGSLIYADESKRGFIQTFFLAPQDKGFFVLNDMLRFVEDVPHQNGRQNGSIAPTAPIHEEAPPVQENHVIEESNGEVYNPHENGVLQVEEEEEEPVAEVVDEVPTDPQVAVESTVKVEVESNIKVPDELPNESQAPKKSYASIVMKDTPVTAPTLNLPKSAPKAQEQQIPVKAAPLAANLPSSADVVDDGNNHEPEGEGHSIYMRNLPFNVPYLVVEEAFKGFGPIKSGGIQIRKNNTFSFGFVEFEVAGAARSAIEASPITIAGCEVVVEEKKSTGSRGPIRGRFPSGRGGGGFKGEGGRGHGGYGGGRGYGRGEGNRNDFGNRGGGRGYHNRSEGFQRNDQNGNGAGRMSRGGGSGIKSSRAQFTPGV